MSNKEENKKNNPQNNNQDIIFFIHSESINFVNVLISYREYFHLHYNS